MPSDEAASDDGPGGMGVAGEATTDEGESSTDGGVEAIDADGAPTAVDADGDAEASMREAVLEDVVAYFEGDHGEPFAAPTEEFLRGSWFDDAALAPEGVVEWQWVNEPFALVCIRYDEIEREHRYEVVEPAMDAFETFVREDVTTVLRNSLLRLDFEEGDDRTSLFRKRTSELMDEHAATVDDGTLHKVLYYLQRDFIEFGPIDPLMRDRGIEDISCDGSNVPVYIYHREFRDLRTNVSFDRRHLNSFVVRLAQRAGRQLSVSDPLVDASLPDGSRIQLTFGGDVATRGSNFTIRKFADIPYTPVDLINWNTFSVEQMAYFWLAIENNKSLIFAGGTGSGKTTSMNAVSFFIPPSAKIVSIEDTREIDLPHDNWIQSVTRSSASGESRGEVSMYNLLQSALRQRPEYLLVGEIRTEENVALTFFQAMGTGHTAYTTIHADSVETALSRLQNPPLNVPTQMLQDLDVLNIQRQIYIDERRVRRNQSVAELSVDADDPEEIASDAVFEWDPRSDTHERVGDSSVLAQIAHDRGWDDDDLEAELAARERVLTFLVENDVYEYEAVATAIQLFQKDPEHVLEALDAGEFDPVELVEDAAERLHDEVAGGDPPREHLDEATWTAVTQDAGVSASNLDGPPSETGPDDPTALDAGDADGGEEGSIDGTGATAGDDGGTSEAIEDIEAGEVDDAGDDEAGR